MENVEEQKVALKGPQKYRLIYPVTWGKNETIEEITIQPLKGKHIKLLKKDAGLQELIQVAAKASGTPVAVFDEMDSQDVLNIVELVGNSL